MSHLVESSPSIVSTLRRIVTLGTCAFALVAVACGPVADGEESTDASAAEAPTAEAPVAASDVDCEALHQARIGIQGAGGNLIYAENAQFFTDMIGDVAELQADIEVLRPYQDIDPEVFGPIREGLENFERDLIAGSEGRFGDITGDYGMASINSLLSDLGC